MKIPGRPHSWGHVDRHVGDEPRTRCHFYQRVADMCPQSAVPLIPDSNLPAQAAQSSDGS